MYCLVNLLIKLSMLYSAEGLAPLWKFIDAPWGSAPRLRITVIEV